MPTFQLFANTGYQYVKTDVDYTVGGGEWTHPVENLGWLLAKSVAGKAWLCVDTATGDIEMHRFAPSESQIQIPAIEFSLPGSKEPIQIEIRASCHGAGEPIDVSFVLDFGNCRTMGLLVENTGIQGRRMPAYPFQLTAHNFNASTSLGERCREKTFDSHVEFIRDSLPRKPVVQIIHHPDEYIDETTGFGPFKRTKKVLATPAWDEERIVDPLLFYDISPIRLGSEAAFFRGGVDAAYGALTGMSSPKRYLWSDDFVTLHTSGHMMWS